MATRSILLPPGKLHPTCARLVHTYRPVPTVATFFSPPDPRTRQWCHPRHITARGVAIEAIKVITPVTQLETSPYLSASDYLVRRKAAQAFVSIIDTTRFAAPSKSHVPEMLKLVKMHPQANLLLAMLREPLLTSMALWLTKDYPLHVLHALTLAHRLTGGLHLLQWRHVVQCLTYHQHWDYITIAVSLFLELNGRLTKAVLHWLIITAIRGKFADTQEDILQLFTEEEVRRTPDPISKDLLLQLPPGSSQSNVGLSDAGLWARDFHSIIGDMPPAPPRKSHAPELVRLIENDPRGHNLLPVLKGAQTLDLAASLIIQHHPLHAMHAVNVAAHLQEGLPLLYYETVARSFIHWVLWDWVPEYFELYKELSEGKFMNAMVLHLLQSFALRGVAGDVKEIRRMLMKVKASRTSQWYLAQLEAISQAHESAGHVLLERPPSTRMMPIGAVHEAAIPIGGATCDTHPPSWRYTKINAREAASASEDSLITAIRLNLESLQCLAHGAASRDPKWSGLSQHAEDMMAIISRNKPEPVVKPSSPPNQSSQSGSLGARQEPFEGSLLTDIRTLFPNRRNSEPAQDVAAIQVVEGMLAKPLPA
ncbi:hypothetical protein OBBRIDRAFT_823961 [Obba rivulosa]|uniref:Uncharacterized protein n=1 Tax=Obba rivulosa TaxID=1052685 RepID=A0A8E2DQ08_9APHY|nr:hypothetical protein OBBRIDRAFT_823961 [Obba rivulosa]